MQTVIAGLWWTEASRDQASIHSSRPSFGLCDLLTYSIIAEKCDVTYFVELQRADVIQGKVERKQASQYSSI